MINNNPTPEEHKKNIKDFLTGTTELIFDNQEKITNGEYVELNRMIAEITIVNNRGGSIMRQDTLIEELRQDALINSLEHRNRVLETTEQLLADRIQQLRRENEELKQRLENIRTISYPQATQTQTQQTQVQPVVQPQVQPVVQPQVQRPERWNYTRNKNEGDTRRIQETGNRTLYQYIQNPETLRYVKRNGRSGVNIERACKESINPAPLQMVVGRMTSLNGHFSDYDIIAHTEIVHFVRLTPQGGRTSHGEGTDRHFFFEYLVF